MFGTRSFVNNYLISPVENLRKRIFTILILEKNIHPTGRLFNYILGSLIVLNITAVILESVKSIYLAYQPFFETLELYTLTIFTLEYLVRIWICTLKDKYSHPFWGRIRFIFSPMALIELMVILPLILALVSEYDFRFLTIFRIMTILRIFKLDRYADAVKGFRQIFLQKKEELVLTFLFLIVLLVVTSSSMYIVEKDANPAFSSIPETMWWAIATLTTVGYGDVYPITPQGKLLGSVIAVLGIATFAVPAGLISSSFTEYIQKKKQKKKCCPHCGKDL